MRKNSLPYQILINLGECLGGILDTIFSTPPQIYEKFSGNYYRKALYDLKKYGYLKEIKKKQKYQLTTKGQMEILKSRIRNKKTKWDGKWRLIIFDIPEEKRSRRDSLRNKLRYFGFKELQKSVWIYPYDVEEELKSILKIYQFHNYARFLIVEKMNYDQDFKKLFFKRS